MKWISKEQPEYVWDEDIWLEEDSMQEMRANVNTRTWEPIDQAYLEIPFREKTKFRYLGKWFTMKNGQLERVKTRLNED
jgi:hypothetical protein